MSETGSWSVLRRMEVMPQTRRVPAQSQALDKDREKQKQFREPMAQSILAAPALLANCTLAIFRSTLEKATQANARRGHQLRRVFCSTLSCSVA